MRIFPPFGLLLAALLAPLLAGCVTPQSEQEQQRLRLVAEGRLLSKRGAHSEARASLRQALELQPDDAEVMFLLAECAAALSQPKEAEGLYLRVLARDPGHERARHALA